MENPFILSDDQLKKLLNAFDQWLDNTPDEAKYPEIFRNKAQKIREDFLNEKVLRNYSHEELYSKIYSYSRSLEGPVHIRMGEKRIKDNIDNLRKSFYYIISSEDSPFKVAQNILEGEYKIKVFSKAFWSPILQARFPDELPNWNNKTEKFLKQIGVNISTLKLTVAERYEILSEAFKYIISVAPKHDFYTINHLMHYGTVIKEGVELIDSFLNPQQRSYWRIGTTDSEGKSHWEKMKNSNYVSVGWKKLENLSDKEPRNKKDFINLLNEAGYHMDNKSTQSNQAGQIFSFYHDIKPGDVVVAQEGQKVMGIGIVTGDYLYIHDDDFHHTRAVDWQIIKNGGIINSEGLQTTVHRLSDSDFIKQIDNLLSKIKEEVKIKEQMNIILYGPPGTGKTYNTIDIAVKIAAPEKYSPDKHGQNKKIYDQLLEKGQIVFTTFHQSMCYEDFIEGIKPLEPLREGDPVNYKVVDGIFKLLCNSASTLTSTTFELSYNKLLDDLNEKENGIKLAVSNAESINISSHPNGTDLEVESESYINSITKAGLKYVSDSRRYAGIWGKYYKAIFKLLSEKYGYEHDKKDINKNFVLIIDEINRGNVAEIFGELITLIEEDKRLGNSEAMEIVLPYSKQKFGVPGNIYIIGTMNTADRSVEALDTALRRRFSFVEMMPDYNLPELQKEIEGIKISDLLKKINQRIIKMLDRDHQIGHSYFLRVRDLITLKQVFKDKIIPLLQEYFYGDYEKLGLILGKGFISVNPNNNYEFANFNVDSEVYDKDVFEIRKEPFDSREEFITALQLLLN